NVAGTPTSVWTSVRSSSARPHVSASSASDSRWKFSLSDISASASPTAAVSVSYPTRMIPTVCRSSPTVTDSLPGEQATVHGVRRSGDERRVVAGEERDDRRALRRAVRGVVCEADARGDGADVDDRSAPRRDEVWDRRAAAAEDRPDVRVEDEVVLAARGLRDRPEQAHACVVAEDVEPAEPLDGRVDEACAGGLVAHVGGH